MGEQETAAGAIAPSALAGRRKGCSKIWRSLLRDELTQDEIRKVKKARPCASVPCLPQGQRY